MMDWLRFMFIAHRAYRGAKEKEGVHFTAVTHHGVPTMCCYVGLGRSAWRVGQIAIEKFEFMEAEPKQCP